MEKDIRGDFCCMVSTGSDTEVEGKLSDSVQDLTYAKMCGPELCENTEVKEI